MATLFSLAEQIRRCTACPLWKSRTIAVPGEGPVTAKVMIVGEAPGNEEDRQGIPFIGRAGKYLTSLLEKNNIKREELFITNAVKCHPKNNRKPIHFELAKCKELWLDEQIDIIKPKLIVILGSIALYSILGERKISDLRGKIVKRDGQQYFVTYHPAASFRSAKVKTLLEKDIRKLGEIAKKL